jgi:DNA polymerase III delta prime subunit
MNKELLTETIRPKTFADFMVNGEPEQCLLDVGYDVNTNTIPKLLNYVFFGSAGLGKTSLAMTMVREMNAPYIYKNGSVDNGIDMIRDEIEPFASAASLDKALKMVIVDEACRLSPQAQDAMKVIIEQYHMVVRFIFIVNRPEKIIDPIWSRCVRVPFNNIGMKSYLLRVQRCCDKLEMKYDPQTLLAFAKEHYPDMRAAVNGLELCTNGVLEIKSVSTIDGFIMNIVQSILNPNVTLADIRKLLKNKEFAMRFDQVYEALAQQAIETNNIWTISIIGEHHHRDPTTPNRFVNLLASVGGIRRNLVSQ